MVVVEQNPPFPADDGRVARGRGARVTFAGAESLDDFGRSVADEGIAEVVVFGEFFVMFEDIIRDADDIVVGTRIVEEEFLKILALPRSASRSSLGIEPDDDAPANAKVPLERNLLARVR